MLNTSIIEAKSKSISFRNLQFEYCDELIYYLINDEKQRLCIFKIMQDEMFKLTRNQIHHEKFQRTYDRLCYLIYIRRIIKHLKQYIEHCSTCQLN